MKNIQNTLILLIICLQSICISCTGTADRQKEHPYLFLDHQRIEELKQQSDDVSVQLKEIIFHYADEALRLPPVKYSGQGFKFGAMRETQRRILCLSMAYLLTDKEEYLKVAKEVLMYLADQEDWGTNHFLDVGEAALAAGIGFDWLYDKLTAEEKEAIIHSIANSALRPALTMHESDDGSSWVNGDFNWNPVCHGGTMVGALAIAEYEPELSRQIIDRAVKNLPIYAKAFEPDGSDAEGPSYWSYGASFNVIAIEALRTATGSAYGLDKYQGFLKGGDYKVQIAGAAVKSMLIDIGYEIGDSNAQVVGVKGEAFNYSDYHVENLNEPVMLWFGRELERFDLMRQEINDIQILHRQMITDEPLQLATSRHIPLELIWWNPHLLGKDSSTPLHYTARGGLPLGITRSSWTDPEAGFIAIKGGTPNHSHGHMDVGSFILEADGVRWALDCGTESYNKMRVAGLDLWNYSQNSSRWTVFRVGPEGHNILRFDGEYQNIEGYGTIQPLTEPDGSMGHRLDLSSSYSGKADHVQRSVSLHPDGTISIQDEWTAKNPQTIVSWQWLTKADVICSAKGLILKQQGEALELVFESPAVRLLNIEVQDVSDPRNIQDSPNPGLKRIVVKLPVGNKSGKLYVKAVLNNTVK